MKLLDPKHAVEFNGTKLWLVLDGNCPGTVWRVTEQEFDRFEEEGCAPYSVARFPDSDDHVVVKVWRVPVTNYEPIAKEYSVWLKAKRKASDEGPSFYDVAPW